jgi:hypothetical protein
MAGLPAARAGAECGSSLRSSDASGSGDASGGGSEGDGSAADALATVAF